MDIAAASMNLSANSVKLSTETGVLKMAMDDSSQNAKMFIETMMKAQKISQPHLGRNVNTLA